MAGQHFPMPQHELEEAAQGHDLFRAPGADLQFDDAREQAEGMGWLPPGIDYDWPSAGTRQQIVSRRQDLYEAMKRLEESAARASGHNDWTERLRNELANLESALQRHIAEIEQPDGLFAEVVDRAPQLAPEVERLRKEHQDLLAGCRKALAVSSKRGADPGDLRRSILAILGLLIVHRQSGAELLFDAYNVDIAAAD